LLNCGFPPVTLSHEGSQGISTLEGPLKLLGTPKKYLTETTI